MLFQFFGQYKKALYIITVCIGMIMLLTLYSNQVQAQKQMSRKERIKGRPAFGRERFGCTTLLKTKRKKSTIGVRVGAPVSVTFKTYSKTRWSFEIAAGVNYAAGLTNSAIADIFKDNKPPNSENANYLSHQIQLPLSFQAKVIRHFPLFNIPSIVFFTGLGIHVFKGGIDYAYSSEQTITASSTERRSATGFRVKDYSVDLIGAGPEAQVGLEYYFPGRFPLVVYLEGGLYYDVLNPSTRGLLLLGGTGIRFSF